MDDLFSDDVKLREKAAGNYRVFADKVRIPRRFRPDWRQLLGDRDPSDGMEWPKQLAKQADKTRWPKYAFGTANAACLLVMHRPGLEKDMETVDDLDRVLFIEPRFPVLGGIPHAHNALFPLNHLKTNPTWNNIHKYLKPAFEGLQNHWGQLMTCNVNTQPDHTGKVDSVGNIRGLKILNQLVTLCQPKVILLCGDQVHKVARSWDPPEYAKIERVAHPSVWQRTSMSLPNGTETAMMVRQSLFGS